MIYYSNAELTAIDIVHYEQYIGGLSRAATILDELAEKLDFRRASDNLFNYTSIATIQRLGYILDDILEQKEIAEVLHSELLTYVKRLDIFLLVHTKLIRTQKRILVGKLI